MICINTMVILLIYKYSGNIHYRIHIHNSHQSKQKCHNHLFVAKHEAAILAMCMYTYNM